MALLTCPNCGVAISLQRRIPLHSDAFGQQSLYCPVCNAVVYRIIAGAVTYPPHSVESVDVTPDTPDVTPPISEIPDVPEEPDIPE